MTGKPFFDALKAVDNGAVQFLDRHGASILASSRSMRFACRNGDAPVVGTIVVIDGSGGRNAAESAMLSGRGRGRNRSINGARDAGP
jgi:hypothetical protein